jgi:DNA-binding CsgD family transcriptional regulator
MQHALKDTRQLHSLIMEAATAAAFGSGAFCITQSLSFLSGISGTRRIDCDLMEVVPIDAEAALAALISCQFAPEIARTSLDRAQVKAFPLHGGVLGQTLMPDHTELLAFCLVRDEQLFGAAGVARRATDGAFGSSDRAKLEAITSALSGLAGLQLRCEELQRRDVVQRTIPAFSGTYCVVDRTAKRVIWTYTSHGTPSCEDAVWSEGSRFAELIERRLPAPEDYDDPMPSFPHIAFGRIVRIADLGQNTVFGENACVAVALTSCPEAAGGLSRRERQIARLLLTGYTTLNAAAILNVSENTIRTYVRRLYRKLDVTNRADLARKCRHLGSPPASHDGHNVRSFTRSGSKRSSRHA